MPSTMRRRLAGSLLLLALPAAAAAQRPDLAALDRYIEQARTAWDVPGLAVAIVKDGRVVLAKGYGVREVGKPQPVDEHTLFAIASNSKAFTAAALATLVDAGKLGWDDRVRDHLPWFQLYDRYVTDELRIRDLLSHRSGLGTFSGDILWWGAPFSAEEVVRRTRYLPQAGPFRASYHYNNLMFIAAGEVVRTASGQSWPAYVRQHLLAPLGMDETVLSVDSLVLRRNVASPHKRVFPRDTAAGAAGVNRPLPWHDWDAMAAAGGIISSASDMAKWLDLQLRGGILPSGDTVFRPRQQLTMWTVHTPIAVSPASAELYPSMHFRGYGLGWSLHDYQGRKIVSHGGAYDGMYSQVLLVPEERLGVVVLTNSMTGIASGLANRIADAYLEVAAKDWSTILLERERASDQRERERRAAVVRQTVANTRPSLPLASYAGTYGGPLYGNVTVAQENGRLVLRMAGGTDLVADLSHLQFDTFRVEWRREYAWFESGIAQFVLAPNGDVSELKLDIPNQDIFFQELELKRRPPD